MAQSPNKSMFFDVRPVQQPEGTYPYGKNGLQSDLKAAVTNEPGFERMSALVPYTLNGIIETDGKPVLFSTDNVYSAIGYFNPATGAYEPVFNDALVGYKLDHKTDHWITGQSQRNYKGEMVVAFTDKVVFPKYLNLDKPNVKRLEDWNLFPYYSTPTIVTSIEEGGRLPLGTYYAAVKYSRNDGTTSAYSNLSLGKTATADGQAAITDKALYINITNADITYDYLTVAIVSRVKGITKAVELNTVPVSPDGQVQVVYTGENPSVDITLEEILTPASVYSRVGYIGQLNDALYIADLKEEEVPNDMQPFVNQVKLKWVSQLLPAVHAPQEHVDGEIKGFMHEEVYAVYLRYKLTKGGTTKAYTIAGNLPQGNDGFVQSQQAIQGFFEGTVAQVQDTIYNFDPGTFQGDTGVWVNQNELYPNTPDFGDNANQKVRHHKMPSVRWCKEHLYPNNPDYGKTSLDILGLKVENIIIPDKYKHVISGYELLYAKRTMANMTVVGQGLMLHGATARTVGMQPTPQVDIYTTGSNWHSMVKTRSSTAFNRGNELILRQDTMRFHAFDILLNKPGIKATYMSPQLKLRRKGLRTTASFLQDGIGPNKDIVTSTVHLLDFTDGPGEVTLPVNSVTGRGVKSGGFYLPNGINVNRFINVRHETCYAGQLYGGTWPLTIQNTSWWTHNSGGRADDPGLNSDIVETYLTNMRVLKADVYNSYQSQVLITAGQAKELTDSSPYYGGDTYVNAYTFHTYGRHESGDDWEGGGLNAPHLGKKVIHRFVCESVSNIALRQEIAGNDYSKFYPVTKVVAGDGTAYPEFWDRAIDPNQFGYSKDLNALNDLLSTPIYYPFRETLTEFPFRIHRGGKLSRQSKARSWRTFLPLDYYEMQKNMGHITHLEGMDDKLLIHTENALFLTQDKAKLDSGLLGVTLGSGDIFQFEPQEAQSAKLGFAGTQHELACVRTPVGYVFVDAKQGEIYLYKGSLENLSAGLSRFLREYLKVSGNNPFTGNGITVGWDQRYKRILLTVKRRVPESPVKVFANTPEFWNNLQTGDIVLYQNRYLRYG